MIFGDLILAMISLSPDSQKQAIKSNQDSTGCDYTKK